MNPLFLLRMKRLAQRGHSLRQGKFFLAVLGICLALATIEWFGGWPDGLKLDRAPHLNRVIR